MVSVDLRAGARKTTKTVTKAEHLGESTRHSYFKMSGYPGYDLKPLDKKIVCMLRKEWFRRRCFGERAEAYKKCESCREIESCSALTLRKYLAVSKNQQRVKIIGP